MAREIVTSENREEYNEKKMAEKAGKKPEKSEKAEKTIRAKIKEHIAYLKKHGDYKDLSDEAAKALSDAVHSHHPKSQKALESKLAQISGYGKRFDSRDYFKMAHAEEMRKGGALKDSGDNLNPDMFTDSGHQVLKHYFNEKL
jgi:hypothetical protein